MFDYAKQHDFRQESWRMPVTIMSKLKSVMSVMSGEIISVKVTLMTPFGAMGLPK